MKILKSFIYVRYFKEIFNNIEIEVQWLVKCFSFNKLNILEDKFIFYGFYIWYVCEFVVEQYDWKEY